MRIFKWSHRRLHSVARKIYPLEKVSDLVSTNAQGDFQYFQTADLLTQGRVETRTALLDISEVKGRDIGDRLDMHVTWHTAGVWERRAIKIRIGSRNGVNPIQGERLRESGANSGLVVLR